MIIEINISRIDVKASPCQGNYIYFLAIGDLLALEEGDDIALYNILKDTFFYFTEVKPFLSKSVDTAMRDSNFWQLNLGKRRSPKYGDVYTILDLETLDLSETVIHKELVEDRCFRLHAGNKVKDTQGCLIPVRDPVFGQFDSRSVSDDMLIGVESSRVAKRINSFDKPIALRFYDIYEV